MVGPQIFHALVARLLPKEAEIRHGGQVCVYVRLCGVYSDWLKGRAAGCVLSQERCVTSGWIYRHAEGFCGKVGLEVKDS